MLVASYNGKVVRFPEDTVRPMGRTATGVRAIKLDEDGQDRVVGMICVEEGSKDTVLVISDKGYGKRTLLDDETGEPIYRITNRGGKGVKTINVTEKTGQLISIQAVTDDNDLMIINRSGLTIRTSADQIRVAGRATQGVKVINLREGDSIASVMAVPRTEEEESVEGATEGAQEGATEATTENVAPATENANE